MKLIEGWQNKYTEHQLKRLRIQMSEFVRTGKIPIDGLNHENIFIYADNLCTAGKFDDLYKLHEAIKKNRLIETGLPLSLEKPPHGFAGNSPFDVFHSYIGTFILNAYLNPVEQGISPEQCHAIMGVNEYTANPWWFFCLWHAVGEGYLHLSERSASEKEKIGANLRPHFLPWCRDQSDLMVFVADELTKVLANKGGLNIPRRDHRN